MSNLGSARVLARAADPTHLRRTMRYIVMTRAAARFMPDVRARELAANLAGADDDLVTVDAIAESIDRRRCLFALEIAEAVIPEAARAIFAAWLEGR